MIRSHRLIAAAVAFCWLGFAIQVGLADPAVAGASESSRRAEPYQQGPLEDRVPFVLPPLPDGVDELLGLSLLAAILYGFRAAGLSRVSERR